MGISNEIVPCIEIHWNLHICWKPLGLILVTIFFGQAGPSETAAKLRDLAAASSSVRTRGIWSILSTSQRTGWDGFGLSLSYEIRWISWNCPNM